MRNEWPRKTKSRLSAEDKEQAHPASGGGALDGICASRRSITGTDTRYIAPPEETVKRVLSRFLGRLNRARRASRDNPRL